jgi:hypothetical protein
MSDEFVSVPIPVSRYAEVIALLASEPTRAAVAQEEPFPPSQSAVVSVDSGVVLSGHGRLADDGTGWPDPQLAELVGWVSSSMRAILRALAESPDEWVSIPTLAERCTVTANEIRGTMRGFGRSFISHYGRERIWPFGWQKRHDDGRYWYYVTRAQSQVILRKAEGMNSSDA